MSESGGSRRITALRVSVSKQYMISPGQERRGRGRAAWRRRSRRRRLEARSTPRGRRRWRRARSVGLSAAPPDRAAPRQALGGLCAQPGSAHHDVPVRSARRSAPSPRRRRGCFRQAQLSLGHPLVRCHQDSITAVGGLRARRFASGGSSVGAADQRGGRTVDLRTLQRPPRPAPADPDRLAGLAAAAASGPGGLSGWLVAADDQGHDGSRWDWPASGTGASVICVTSPAWASIPDASCRWSPTTLGTARRPETTAVVGAPGEVVVGAAVTGAVVVGLVVVVGSPIVPGAPLVVLVRATSGGSAGAARPIPAVPDSPPCRCTAATEPAMATAATTSAAATARRRRRRGRATRAARAAEACDELTEDRTSAVLRGAIVTGAPNGSVAGPPPSPSTGTEA